VVLGGLLAVVCLGGVAVGLYFATKRGGNDPAGDAPGGPVARPPEAPGRAALDPESVDNTRAWAAEAVKRLKAAEAGGPAAAKSEVARTEKDLRERLLGKRVRWAFAVQAVDEGELKLETFFGTDAGSFQGDDPKLKGRPMRRLYFRVYLNADEDNVKVGDEVKAAEAQRLRNGGQFTVNRTVTEVTVDVHDKWFMPDGYSNVVDVLEPYCVTVVLSRKK
jgi:hypothetical protein